MIRAKGSLTVDFDILLDCDDISEYKMTMRESDKLILDAVNKILKENNVKEISAVDGVFVENHYIMANDELK